MPDTPPPPTPDATPEPKPPERLWWVEGLDGEWLAEDDPTLARISGRAFEYLPATPARLAAPDLLAACEEAKEIMEALGIQHTYAYKLLGPAIAKARGVGQGEGETGGLRTMMTFAYFSRTNRLRCESPKGFHHTLDSWSLSDWITATTGELGEAANIAKKLNRVRDGIPGNQETPQELRAALREEIADVFIYLDLLAQSQGFQLEDAVREKFNKTSRKIGSPIRLAETSEGETGDPHA